MKTLATVAGTLALVSMVLGQTAAPGATTAQPPPTQPKLVLPGGPAVAPPVTDKRAPATAPGANNTPAPGAATQVAPSTPGGTAVTPAVSGNPGTPPAKTDPKAKSTDPKGAKKDEPPPKVQGVAVPRGDRGFLGVEIVDGNFKVGFYDSKKKPIPVDVARAVLRWDPKYKVGQERMVLNPSSDGKSLTASRPVRPPYNFKLYMTLIKDPAADDAAVGENFVIDFKQ